MVNDTYVHTAFEFWIIEIIGLELSHVNRIKKWCKFLPCITKSRISVKYGEIPINHKLIITICLY